VGLARKRREQCDGLAGPDGRERLRPHQIARGPINRISNAVSSSLSKVSDDVTFVEEIDLDL